MYIRTTSSFVVIVVVCFIHFAIHTSKWYLKDIPVFLGVFLRFIYIFHYNEENTHTLGFVRIWTSSSILAKLSHSNHLYNDDNRMFHGLHHLKEPTRSSFLFLCLLRTIAAQFLVAGWVVKGYK